MKARRPEFHVIFRELIVMTLEFHNNAKLEPSIWVKKTKTFLSSDLETHIVHISVSSCISNEK